SSVMFNAAFLLAMFILLIISTIAYRNSISLENTQQHIIRSHQIRGELNNLVIKLKDAESAQRGHLLTYKNEFLKPYEEARKRIHKSFQKLEGLTEHNPEQRERLQELRWSVNASLYALEDGLAIESQYGIPDSLHK